MAAADGRCPLWRPCLGGGGTSTTCTMPTMDLHAANIASASCCSACAGTCTSQQPATGFGAELQKFHLERQTASIDAADHAARARRC